MGLFSGVKKAVSGVVSSAKDIVKKVTSPVVDTVKKVSGSSLGQMGLEALGSYFGYPGLGSALSGFLSGGADGQYDWGDLGSLMGTGLSSASAKAISEKQRSQTLEDYDRFYKEQLQGIQMQNATAKEIASEANWMAQNNAREQMGFQAQQIQNQMAFQERMSNSAHQREVADLRAAGLNPILSGTGGMGASAPSGGAASGASGSVVAAPVRSTGDAVTSAMGAFRAMADAMKAQATAEYTRGAQTTATYAGAQAAGAAAEQSRSQAELNRIRVGMTESQMRNMDQEYRNLVAMESNIKATGLLTLSQRREVEQRTENLKEIYKSLRLKGEIDESEFGYWNEVINRGSQTGEGFGNLLKALRSVLRSK